MPTTTYDVPVPAGRGPVVLVGLLLAFAVALAVVAVAARQPIVAVPVVLAALAGLMVWLQWRENVRRGAVRATLDDTGLELAQAGAPARFLRWSDVRTVRQDGSTVEFQVRPGVAGPAGLAVATAGEAWSRFDEFCRDIAARLDADRGYTRVCEVDQGEGGCSNPLGCAGQGGCQGGHAHA